MGDIMKFGRSVTWIWIASAELAALAGGACAPIEQPGGRLFQVKAGAIVDAQDQALYLHGINVHAGAKTAPAHLVPLLADDLKAIGEGGFNTIRLLTFWGAVAPSRDRLDSDYLERLQTEVAKLEQAGFRVVIDMHQDLWGSPFGDGAADWTCPEDVKAGYQASSPWWLNYFSDQVSGCFDELWAGRALQADLIRAWQQVALAVCESPAVVGFDLFNEPYPGGAIGKAYFDPDVLYPFYRRLMDAIEPVCPGRLYFIEPSRAYDFGLSDAITIEPEVADRVVLAPHFYPAEVHEPGRAYDGDATALGEDFRYLYGTYLQGETAMWFGEVGGLLGNPGFGDYLADLFALLAKEGKAASLWAFARGGGGFDYLDREGVRQPVFEGLAMAPMPAVLPSVPQALAVNVRDRELRVKVHCVRDRSISLHLATDAEWQWSGDGVDLLTAAVVDGFRVQRTCIANGVLDLVVRPR